VINFKKCFVTREFLFRNEVFLVDEIAAWDLDSAHFEDLEPFSHVDIADWLENFGFKRDELHFFVKIKNFKL